jgi:two-component sensor histidine kinase
MELNAEADLSKSYVELAEVYIKNNQSATAIPYLLDAYELLAFSGHKNGVSEALKYLFKSYESVGDYKNALKYQTLYFVYEDSIKSENNLNAIQKYESELKLKDKETKIAIQDVEIKSSEEKLRIKKVQVFYFIVGVVLLSTMLLIVLLQVRKQKRNNTLLKKQKAMIEKSDKEKEVLIREVHHRVKNNLQIISSLFTIEQRKTDNIQVRDALSYGKQRIEAMSIIHEKLYKQSDLSNINLEDYIFEISENLLDSYDKVNVINVKVNSDVSSIDTDVAINLGLVVAELMTNSIKHGFSSENENFVIAISIMQTGNSIRFDYSDNGHGVGTDFDINLSHNFGHRLIVSIVKKLKGDIIQDNVAFNGFKFSFIFKDFRHV